MKKILPQSIYLFTCLILAITVNARQADSTGKIPAAKYSRQRNVDIRHIALDLKFNWEKKQAYGSAVITLAPLNKTDHITLDAGMLTIHSITLTNKTPLLFTYDGSDKDDGLQISLHKMYQAGESITIKIQYATNWVNETDPNNIGGSTGKGLRFIEPTTVFPTRKKQLWSMGEPASNRYWFPCYDGMNDLRTTELLATVDKELTALSNGTLISVKNNGNGTRSFHWKMERPYPNYLTSMVIGEYTDVKQEYNGIALHTYCYPEEKKAAEATIDRLPDMMRFFSEKTGIKYPYPSYSQVMVQEFPFPGLTSQSTLSVISDNMIDDDRTHADFLYLWDGVESDALAYQWFGNYIMPRNWSHAWLSKSFSHYFDGLYTDHKNGHDEFLSWYHMPFDLAAVNGDWNAGYRHPIVTDHYDNTETFTSDNYTRLRGAIVLRMLQKQLGEEKWWRAMRHYVKTNANKQVTTEDLITAIEESTGETIRWFFDQWIYKMGMPVFEITKEYDATNKELVLRVKQVQQPDSANQYPQVNFFKGKLVIEINEKTPQVWLEAKAENVFRFKMDQAPRLVNFDFESTWIKEIRFVKSREELLYQLENSKDIIARWQSIDKLTEMAKDEKTSVDDKEKIYAAFRKVILSKAYWRLRNYAMLQLRGLLSPPYDESTISMLLKVIREDSAWVRTAAITFLGMTKDAKYADLYINAFSDTSDRVINAAAIALGKCKSEKAFDALVKLKHKPSWKSQGLISALNGLQQLGDARGAAIALDALKNIRLPRWFLGVATWDYPIAAANTLVALNKVSDAFPIVFNRFEQAMKENDINGTFSHALLIAILGDTRGMQAFTMLKEKYKDDANAMNAVNMYETQLQQSISREETRKTTGK